MVEPVGLTKKFRGYKPQEVDQYLEKLTQNQEEEIKNLEKQLENLQEEKNLLYKKIYELQEKWATKSEEKELLDLALLRTKSIAELLLQKAARDVEQLLNEAEKKNADNRKKTANLEEEIASIQTQIQTLLDSLNNVFQDTEKTDKVSQLSSNIIKFNDFMNEKKSKDAEKENIEEETKQEEQPIAADGTRASDITKNTNIRENNQQYKKMMEKLAKVLNNQEEEDIKKQSIEKEKSPKQPEDSFWSKDEKKAEQEIPSAFEPVQVTEKEEDTKTKRIEMLGVINEKTAQDFISNQNTEIKEEIQKEIKNLENHEHGTKKTESEQKRPSGIISSSPAISAEINNIRFKYITGKLAGRDLLDSGGKTIITKGEVITSEIVAKVEAEGKLPELIVNMVLPGMEE